YEHWDRQHNPGGTGVEPLCLQPRWEERHDDSGKSEECRVKGCESPGEPVGPIAGPEALPSNWRPGDRASGVHRPRAPLELTPVSGCHCAVILSAEYRALIVGHSRAPPFPGAIRTPGRDRTRQEVYIGLIRREGLKCISASCSLTTDH